MALNRTVRIVDGPKLPRPSHGERSRQIRGPRSGYIGDRGVTDVLANPTEWTRPRHPARDRAPLGKISSSRLFTRFAFFETATNRFFRAFPAMLSVSNF